MVGLVGAFLRDVDVGGLLRRQFGQLDVQLLELQAGDVLVQLLGQDVDADGVLLVVLPQLDLGEGLVGEGGAHHVRGVAGAAAEVDQAALGEQDDPLAVGEDDVIDLRLDLLPGVVLERRHVDLVVEVADVADDGLILHLGHVVVRDDLVVAGGRHEDVGLVGGVLHGDDAVAFHRGLQRADRVDLGDPHLGREGAQGLGRTLAHVAVAGDDGDLAGDHHVGGALDAVHQRLAAAVQVVELGLGDRVVDVDGGELQLAALVHLVEAVDAGGGLLGDALDGGEVLGVPAGLRGDALLDGGEEDALLLAGGLVEDVDVRLGAGAEVEQQGRVPAVVEDHVRVPAVGPLEDLVGVLPVLRRGTRPCRRRRGCRRRRWRRRRDPGSRRCCTRPSGPRRRGP